MASKDSNNIISIRPFKFRPLSDVANDVTDTAEIVGDFVPFGEDKKAPPKGPVYKESEIQGRIDEAYRQGVQAGKQEGVTEGKQARFEVDQQLIGLLNGMDQKLEGFLKSYQQHREISEKNTVQLAVQIAEKIAREALEQRPLPVIEAMVQRTFARVYDEAAIEILVHESLVDGLQARLAELLAVKHYKGDVTTTGRADIPVGDCQIRWKDGEAIGAAEPLWQKVEAAIGTQRLDISDVSAEAPETMEEGSSQEADGAETLSQEVASEVTGEGQEITEETDKKTTEETDSSTPEEDGSS